MSQSTQLPLARLIVFIVMLSVAGSILAGLHYYAVDLPQQQVQRPPANGNGPWTDCLNKCQANYRTCDSMATSRMEANQCSDTASACDTQCIDNYLGACRSCHAACGTPGTCWDACPC